LYLLRRQRYTNHDRPPNSAMTPHHCMLFGIRSLTSVKPVAADLFADSDCKFREFTEIVPVMENGHAP
jgi:hypothetical protein